MNILAVEEVKERVDGIDPLVWKCRAKAYVMQECFDAMARGDHGTIEDPALWAEGMSHICREINDTLGEVNDLTDGLGDGVKLYSLDQVKVEEEKKYLKSIGIPESLLNEAK